VSIQWHIETHDKLTSTQDVIKEMARMGHPEGTVVQALQQTAGRGRHGRGWVSDKGNLYLSLMLKPASDARHIGQMGLLTGLAVAETIRKYMEDPDVVQLKWPNDVLLDGHKCAGMLIETQLTPKNSLSWVAVGIGINVSSAPLGLGECMDHYSNKPFSLTAIRTTLLTNIDKYYVMWSQQGFDPIKENWLKYAHRKGTKVKVRIGPQIEEGTFYGIDDEGNLMITDHDLRMKKVTAGEVYL
jgi:BirA family transcriptional regulator, biotin operon repressor / biotin---[acetyl-CoA-carboxylase] ligase